MCVPMLSAIWGLPSANPKHLRPPYGRVKPALSSVKVVVYQLTNFADYSQKNVQKYAESAIGCQWTVRAFHIKKSCGGYCNPFVVFAPPITMLCGCRLRVTYPGTRIKNVLLRLWLYKNSIEVQCSITRPSTSGSSAGGITFEKK